MLVDLKDNEIEMINNALDLLNEHVSNTYENEFESLGLDADGTVLSDDDYLADVTAMTDREQDDMTAIDNLRSKLNNKEQK